MVTVELTIFLDMMQRNEILCSYRKAVTELGPAASVTDLSLVVEGVGSLPYTLTEGQKKALESLLADMKKSTPLDGVLQVVNSSLLFG